MQSRTFDTSTIEGLKAAERYQARLYNKFDKVTVTVVGVNKVKIWGQRNPLSDPRSREFREIANNTLKRLGF